MNTHEFLDTPSVWGPSEALVKVYKDAQEKAKKPSKDEVKKANIAASEEKSQAKVARQEEASKESSLSATTKRVASTAEPRGSEREEGGTNRPPPLPTYQTYSRYRDAAPADQTNQTDTSNDQAQWNTSYP